MMVGDSDVRFRGKNYIPNNVLCLHPSFSSTLKCTFETHCTDFFFCPLLPWFLSLPWWPFEDTKRKRRRREWGGGGGGGDASAHNRWCWFKAHQSVCVKSRRKVPLRVAWYGGNVIQYKWGLVVCTNTQPDFFFFFKERSDLFFFNGKHIVILSNCPIFQEKAIFLQWMFVFLVPKKNYILSFLF